MKKIIEYATLSGIKFKENELLKNHTTFRIGGPSGLMVFPNNESEIINILDLCINEKIRHIVLGRGSNILASDEGFDGCVIELDQNFSKIELLNNNVIFAESGASLSKLCKFALDNSLSGLEFAYGIPGNVGGAVYMNAGAYGGEINNVLLKVNHIEPPGERCCITKDAAKLSYRHSIYQENKYIITGAYFQLSKGNREDIENKMNELLQRRRQKQPLDYPSGGSFFKRPEGYYAAQLLEECGLKGYSVGDAQVSKKHAGFIINTGNATAHDVLELGKICCDIVLEKKGVRLEREVELVK